jgi:transcription antitermination factor NusG
MPRFKVGDRVKILTDVATPFAGLEGTVGEVLPHERNITSLDRYTVVFEWGEKKSFYDVQLAHVER